MNIQSVTGEAQFPIAYEFKDIETGETFSSGDIDRNQLPIKRFNASKGYFKAKSIPNQEWIICLTSQAESMGKVTEVDS